MEDVPQPAAEPYSPGDYVKIYLGHDDTDEAYHGTICEVIADRPDGLGAETGRPSDSHRYRLRSLDTGDELPTMFRHYDLVTVES